MNLGATIQDRQVSVSALEADLKMQKQKYEQSVHFLEETQRALLNVMEDLESTKIIMEVEKAKDEAMLASIGDGLIAVDNDRRVVVLNRAVEKMLGWKSEEMVGRELTSLPLADGEGNILPLDKRPTFKAINQNKQIKGSYFFIKKDETRIPISILVTPIILKGKTIGAIDTFRDITHEQEIDKSKNEFVSLASHQLRTPLGIMKWYLEVLKDDKYINKSSSVIKKYIHEIYTSNERVLDLVRDLLSVSRIEQGHVKNSPSAVDIVNTIKEIFERMKPMALKKNITLRLKVPKDRIPVINIDLLRFQEVIENLIVNAIIYTTESGNVRLLFKKEKDNFLISVKDTGIGILASDKKKLFTKFFRGENALPHNSEGSGLGLYVVKSYVESWGGEIFVESKAGEGSTFTISLPIKLKK